MRKYVPVLVSSIGLLGFDLGMASLKRCKNNSPNNTPFINYYKQQVYLDMDRLLSNKITVGMVISTQQLSEMQNQT